jgi:WD40 repeat protein
MSTNWPFALAVCILLNASRVSAEPLATELKSRSATEGLGLASFLSSSGLNVTYFDGSAESRMVRVPGLDGLYDIEPRSQSILGYSGGPFNPPGGDIRRGLFTMDAKLFSLDGRPPRPVRFPRYPIRAVLSPDQGSLAVLSYTGAASISLQYGPLDWSSVQTVYSVEKTDEQAHSLNFDDNYSWSPDQAFLTYSLETRIYIFNLATNTSKSVAEGVAPCWSPDGSAIAYRSRSRDLMLYDLHTGATRQLSRWFGIVGFPRWSPDSKYIFFVRSSPLLALRNLRTLPSTEFMVMRVSDGETVTVTAHGAAYDNRTSYWIRAPRQP